MIDQDESIPFLKWFKQNIFDKNIWLLTYEAAFAAKNDIAIISNF